MNPKKYKYDFLGIFLRSIGIPINRKNKYVCSNFVAEIFENAGIYKFDKKICLIRPKDFESIKSDKVKEIYSGYFCDYK